MMFAIERLLKASLLVVGVLVVGLGMYAAFQIQEIDAHNANEPPRHRHYELLEVKWGICGPFVLTWTEGKYRYTEACYGFYYHKFRGYEHGVDAVSCIACGRAVTSRKAHWVDHMYGKCGYWSCLYSSCPSHSGNYDDN